MCRDFIAVHHSAIDSTSLSRRRTNELHMLIKEEGLFDVWRNVHGTEKDYTFGSNALNVYSRIDRFLLEQPILHIMSEAKIGMILWFDHAPISLTISLDQNNS